MHSRILMMLMIVALIVLPACLALLNAQDEPLRTSIGETEQAVSFKTDILPVFEKHCLPCHAEDNANPSELSLDSHELLMIGGKHGRSVIPGNPGESILVRKFGPKPPFGDRMPLDPKRKQGGTSPRQLSEEEIGLIERWIGQGAKNN
jgi:hypothetical protein